MAGIKITRINHVGIPITDRKKTLPFYRDLLGINVIPSQVDSEKIVWTQLIDGAMIHTIEEAKAWHAAFQVEDIDSTRKALQDAGFEITGDGERHDGQKHLFVNDPDGNRIEFATESGRIKNDRQADEWGYTS
ncbi:MAG: VOC family protein [Chloroflexi bacterium]|nr:VOC family protein [Chloroflexota bacterium]